MTVWIEDLVRGVSVPLEEEAEAVGGGGEPGGYEFCGGAETGYVCAGEVDVL